MTITLTIESVDSLPDGGPISYQARNRGFEIGRQQHLDWTLPDPSRYISGLHCDVRFEKGGYWLYDVSTNGTFLNGSTSRMKSPHLLAAGDRLEIGPYFIRVELEQAPAPRPDPFAEPVRSAPQPSASAAPSGDIWDSGAPAPPPIDRRDLMPETRNQRREGDFSEEFVAFPEIRAPVEERPRPASAPRPPPEPKAEELHSFARPLPPSTQGSASIIPGPSKAPSPLPTGPRAMPFPDENDMPAAAKPPSPFLTPPPVPFPPQPASGAAPSQAQSRFMEGIAAGAGVPVETFAGRDPADVGREVGEFIRVCVDELAQLLRARAAAKAMTKSSSRTMIGATDNNPLKFIPVTGDIIESMFTRRRPGFLGAKASLEAGFGDLKRHELATFAAMQKALSRLLDDLSPETIAAKVEKSAFASTKSRSWDLFVARWESKSEPYENGMLDAFFAYFAEEYDKAGKKG